MYLKFILIKSNVNKQNLVDSNDVMSILSLKLALIKFLKSMIEAVCSSMISQVHLNTINSKETLFVCLNRNTAESLHRFAEQI